MQELDRVRYLIETRDRLIGLFGMVVEEVAPGSSRVSMSVHEGLLNTAALCHGGAIFSLADVAFALACNSHGTKALALESSINFIRPVSAGETITAAASEISCGKTTGLYTVLVTNNDGRPVAYMKATAYRFPERLPD